MTQSWYPFYWSDYSGKTLHLTQGQHGAYMLLLRYIYTTEKPIANKSRYSIAMAMLDQEKQNVDFVLEEFFERRGDHWHSTKAESIIADAKEKHERRVNSGSKGGVAKSSNAKAVLRNNTSNALARTRVPQPQPDKNSGTEVPSSPPTPMPEWIPIPEWNAFKKFRKKIKHAMTEEAEVLVIRELEILRSQGHEPAAVLNQSILRGWRGVFPIKDENRSGKQQAMHSEFEKQDYYSGTEGFIVT